MILAFKTKANAYGNKKVLVIETANKIFTTENNFFSCYDFIEIKEKDRKTLIKDFVNNPDYNIISILIGKTAKRLKVFIQQKQSKTL